MKDLKHIKRFNESQENLNISDVISSESSTWDDIFERLAIKSNFEEFWKECEKIKLEYIEPSRK
jgi:hypothetical protein